jgi:hypothetical protein
MFGKLFGKKQADAAGSAGHEKLSGPKEILQPVGQTLVISYKLEPDWVWGLKTVTRANDDSNKHIEFRVYDGHETSAQGIAVKNFHSLDSHPELILFSGWLDKKTKDLELVDHRAAREKAV